MKTALKYFLLGSTLLGWLLLAAAWAQTDSAALERVRNVLPKGAIDDHVA